MCSTNQETNKSFVLRYSLDINITVIRSRLVCEALNEFRTSASSAQREKTTT